MPDHDTETLDQDWSNYWQGRTAENAGSALVGIENHPDIHAFWEKNLSGIERNITAIDLACGAGTVANVMCELGFVNVSGLDLSASAIDVLSKRLPDVKGYVAPADDTPFDDKEFDLIVSQFGFEYGDFATVIPEIARILKGGGHFFALSHHSGGGIHAEVSEQLDEVLKIKETGFLPAARELFETALAVNPEKTQAEVSAIFRPAQSQLLELATTQKGLAEHIYVSTQRMFRQRKNYYPQDIYEWFDGMSNEVNRFIGRMSSMKSAAIDESKLKQMLDLFSKCGIEMEKPEPLIDQHNNALGWMFKGQKQI
ncbi:MAG: class I SAM-dependent methyltransferase [Hellea sp.]|nr:class I SAM-dependent methyltransferase [Hellea sp.]